MQTLHFSMVINAPREKVWQVMLGDSTYREWTAAFSEGSYFEGSWDVGSTIRFVGPGADGKLGGLVGTIKENRLHEYISIEYYGVIEDGVEDTESDKIKKWVGATENYTFQEIGAGTMLLVDLDVAESEQDYMSEAWPRALMKLKEIAEK